MVDNTIFSAGASPTQANPVTFPLARQSTVDITDTVAATGVVAIVTVDTTSLSANDTFTVALTGVAGQNDSTFFDTNGTPTVIPATSFNVTATPPAATKVPLTSPVAFAALAQLLFACGAAALRRSAGDSDAVT